MHHLDKGRKSAYLFFFLGVKDCRALFKPVAIATPSETPSANSIFAISTAFALSFGG